MLVGLWCLTTLSTIFQLYRVSIGKDKKKVKIKVSFDNIFYVLAPLCVMR